MRPEDATLLYFGNRHFEQYGLCDHYFIIYACSGSTYLRWEQCFSGAEMTQ